MLSNGAYFSRLRRYLSYIRKWSRWPEELARTSKRLWTVIMSATIAQAGAIRENDSAPTVFLSSTWQETRNKMDKQMAAETSRKNMMPFWENYLQLMQPQERTYFSFFRYKRIFISNAFKQYRTFYSGGIQFSVTDKSSNLQISTPKIDTKWRKMLSQLQPEQPYLWNPNKTMTSYLHPPPPCHQKQQFPVKTNPWQYRQTIRLTNGQPNL